MMKKHYSSPEMDTIVFDSSLDVISTSGGSKNSFSVTNSGYSSSGSGFSQGDNNANSRGPWDED